MNLFDPARRFAPVAAVGIDADDTLWHSENQFEATHALFRDIVAPWAEGAIETLDTRLYDTEVRNLPIFGYGVKGYTLSMIETAIAVTGERIPAEAIRRIIDLGKVMMDHPVHLIEGAAEAVKALMAQVRLILITKGDLFHQEAKVARSGIADLFERIEIISEKNEATYDRILRSAGVDAASFVMVGNSLRSDIMPVLALGGRAVHIPYRITWAHEVPERPHESPPGFHTLETIAALPQLILRLGVAAGSPVQ